MKQALNLPAYRRLLTAYTFNELAWGVGTVALALLVYHRTGSAVGAAGFFLCASFVPALLSPLVVARLDQRPMRRVLPALYALEMLAFLVLAAFVGHFSVAVVLVVALADGTVGLTARALARTASVSVLTRAGLLREGNAIANASFAVCFMLGPAIGGVLVAAGGTRLALLVNSGLFATMALTLATARRLPEPPDERVPSAGRLRAALRHAASQLPIRRLLGLQGVALVFFTMSIPVEVVFAQHTLHAGPGGYGALLSAWGAGAIAGSAIYARGRRLPSWILMSGGAAAVGSGFIVMAVAPSIGVALGGAAISGTGNGIEVVAMRTTLQELVGESWMARVMSLNESLTEAVPGIGIALGGALAALGSPRLAFSVAAAGSLIVTAVTIVVLRDQPESGPDPDPDGLPLAPVHGVSVMGAGLGDAAGADVTAPAPQDRDGAAVSAPDGR